MCPSGNTWEECGKGAVGSASNPWNAVRAGGPASASPTHPEEGANSLAGQEQGAATGKGFVSQEVPLWCV